MGSAIYGEACSYILRGALARGDQTTLSIKRVEYAAVRPVAIKNKIRKNRLLGLYKENSRIKSLE